MTIMNIYKFPDPILKVVAQPIVHFDSDLAQLAESMLETMYDANGIGLAATQVGIDKRLIVVDIFSAHEDKKMRDPHIFVNPQIIEKSGETTYEEGCLSVIEFTAQVQRYATIKLRYQTLTGEFQEREVEGLFSICLQHEMDHLNGILFIDHLPPLKQKMIKKKLAKLAKSTETATVVS